MITKTLLIAFAVYAIVTSGGLALADEYRLDSGDVLNVKLLESKEMSGDVIVGADGVISLPGVGAVIARGETLRGLETKLRNLLAKTIVQPSLAIQVIEYRPFFVLGDVAEAGKYPFISDLNVLKAVSLAKGFKRNNSNNNQFSKQLANLRAKQALNNNIVALASARIRLARVLAEESGEKSFNFEPGKEVFSKLPILDRMLKEERELFAKRKEAHEVQLAQVEATIAARKLETESYNERSASQDDLHKHLEEEITLIKGLRKKGLVPIERLNRLIREQLNIRGQTLQTTSLLRQSQVSLSLSKEKLIALTLGRKIEIAQDIRYLRDQIANLEASIDGEIAIMDNTDGGQLRSGEPSNVGYDFAIYRNGVLLNQKIDFNTSILPDDTLIVIRKSLLLDTVQLYKSSGG